MLVAFLKYFRDKGLNRIEFTLSDKDWSEIGALQHVFPEAKHQLCFWHCLRAVKTRLSTLRRQPAHYDVEAVINEFPGPDCIDRHFLPLAQQPVSAPVSHARGL